MNEASCIGNRCKIRSCRRQGPCEKEKNERLCPFFWNLADMAGQAEHTLESSPEKSVEDVVDEDVCRSIRCLQEEYNVQ